MPTPRLCAHLLILAASAVIPALAKPNFTGDWTLNTTKSSFGQMPAPSSATSNITHNDAKLVVHSKEMTENGEMVLDFTYMTDGTESTNELMGAPMTSTVKWDGDTLTFDSKGKFSDTDFTLKDKWTISDDGKTLSMDRAITSSMGESPQTLIFEKK